MKESLRIADELHRAFFGTAWHGPAVKEVIEGVTAHAAAAHALPAAHSIWELVHHLQAWIAEAAATVQGKPYESLQGDRDWPLVEQTSEVAWGHAVAALEQAEQSLEAAVVEMSEEELGEGDRSLYYLLHGIAQHHAYHAGQIVLLKKAYDTL